MISRIILYKGKLVDVGFNRKKRPGHWVDTPYDDIPPESPDANRILYHDVQDFLMVGEQRVWKDEIPRRMFLKIRRNGVDNKYLVMRLVPNPDKVYKQLDGYYEYAPNKSVKVIGQQILDGKYKLGDLPQARLPAKVGVRTYEPLVHKSDDADKSFTERLSDWIGF